MTFFLWILCWGLLFTGKKAVAQNVGIGITEPVNKLHVAGNFLVNQPYVSTQTTPTALQTKAMLHASTITFAGTDSTGYIYDPGGPSDNYTNSLTAFINVNNNLNCIGFEISFEDMDMAAGDSFIIKESPTSTNLSWYAVGNGYNNLDKITISGNGFYIFFKSNNDNFNGRGFALLFKRLYNNNQDLKNVTSFAGNSLFYDAKTSALRVGLNNSSLRGKYSFASGYLNNALGEYSFAGGFNTQANGNFSMAMGSYTTASGQYSTAFGNNTFASGSFAVATGLFTTASGYASTSMGENTTASGNYSFAAGYRVSTFNHKGSFFFGDSDPNNKGVRPLGFDNQFAARFNGGYYFISSDAGTDIGVQVLAGGNAWVSMCDENRKENFEPLNGEDILQKIKDIKFSSWNYKTQDPKLNRHYGIMAQDFHHAFGRDKYGNIGNDTTVNPIDIIGIDMAAIKALEKRTRELKQQLEKQFQDHQIELLKTSKLNEIIEKQQQQINDQEKRLAALEMLLNK